MVLSEYIGLLLRVFNQLEWQVLLSSDFSILKVSHASDCLGSPFGVLDDGCYQVLLHSFILSSGEMDFAGMTVKEELTTGF